MIKPIPLWLCIPRVAAPPSPHGVVLNWQLPVVGSFYYGMCSLCLPPSVPFPLPRAIDKCESLVKDLYSKLGLQYRESSSEDEDLAAKAMEVIEIPDEDDDDVMSVDPGWKHSSVAHCTAGYQGEGCPGG